MKISKSMRISALLLSVLLVFSTGCTAKKSLKSNVKYAGTPWEVTEYDLDEIINNKGEYIVEKLNPVTVAELKTVGDKQVIYHRGQPYLFHAMHMRIDHLISEEPDGDNKLSTEKMKNIFENGIRRIKESGYNTVILYISWERFYNGKTYDFSEIEYQYNMAKKYDLNIMWNWFGYDVCGFGGYRTWQFKDQEKYPPLRDENGDIIWSTSKYLNGELSGQLKPVPDLSAQSFIDIEVEAIKQFSAWLNVNDTDRRTIGIQVENEINHDEGGHGVWFSQYDALLNLINELSKAVKEGPYSMITYINLMSKGWDMVIDGRDWMQQVKGCIDLEYLDIVGYDFYDATLSDGSLRIESIEQDDNPHLMVEFGPCAWSLPAQTNILLKYGYGIGYYLAIQYNDTTPSFGGFFKYDSAKKDYVYRDGSDILGGYYTGELDVVASEFVLMNHSINALSEKIAVAPNDNMIYLNKTMSVTASEANSALGKTFTFETNCYNDLYGSTALLIKENDSTYYTYASKTATITVDGGIKSASEGRYENGKWVKSKDVTIVDGKMTYEAGKAYQFII